MSEIERKFRLPVLPAADTLGQGVRIVQGYVLVEPVEVRLRKKAERCYLTVKGPGSIEREEWETEIPEWVFERLWPSTEGKRIEKTRYAVEHASFVLEVDEYHGALSGLVTMECEFVSREAGAVFVLPDWASGAEDVSADERLKNYSLALRGLAT